MRTTALVTGILGGVFGIILGLVAMAVGGIGNALEEGTGDSVVGLGVSAIAAAVVAIICVSVFFGGKAQGWMALGLLIAGIWHIISISYFGILGGILILLAALFAFLGRSKGPELARAMAGISERARTCTNCGAGVPEDVQYCGRCGQLTMATEH